MNAVIVIDAPEGLRTLVSELAENPHVAVDTESNGYYAYYDRICLIQMSTAEQDYIVDPLALGDIAPLEAIFSNPDIEKIMHAASNDIAGLKRDFGFRVERLFDTALACKLLGFQHLGLSRIIDEHFGVQLNKKWQRCDWGKRPLIQEQLDYARLDVHYLIALRHQLTAELKAQELWEKAQELFHKAARQEIQKKLFDANDCLRIHGARVLDRMGKRTLRALYNYRDARARRLDRAPFRVFSNETLLRLARHRPQNRDELLKTGGLPRSYRNGRLALELLAVIESSVAEHELLAPADTLDSGGDPGVPEPYPQQAEKLSKTRDER
jgi:ribonuclease D